MKWLRVDRKQITLPFAILICPPLNFGIHLSQLVRYRKFSTNQHTLCNLNSECLDYVPIAVTIKLQDQLLVRYLDRF